VTIQTPRERHESLREALENLADQYDVEAIIDRLAHICNAIAHRATNDWHDDDLAVAYTKLSTDLKHVKDTSLLTDAYTAHLKRLQSEITSDS
jgi:hypothetical protein